MSQFGKVILHWKEGLYHWKIGTQCVHVWLTKPSCFDGEGYKLLVSAVLTEFLLEELICDYG